MIGKVQFVGEREESFALIISKVNHQRMIEKFHVNIMQLNMKMI